MFYKAFIVTFILTLVLVNRGHGFKFSISRELEDGKLLERDLWTNIELLENCENDVNEAQVTFKIDTPSDFASKDQNFTIFFANVLNNVLEVHLKQNFIEGIFFTTPYELEKRMTGTETNRTTNNNRIEISGAFPKSWLPVNCTLVSGSIDVGDGKYYNYYGLRNFKLSIPDLKVLEEYMTYESCN